MLRVGEKKISGLYAGKEKIEKAYLGENLVFRTKKPPRLPEGYTEVSYICPNSLGAYIDTGVNVSGVLKISLDIDLTYLKPDSGVAHIAGIWTRSGYSPAYKFSKFEIQGYKGGNYILMVVSSGENSQNTQRSGKISFLTLDRMKVEVDQSKKSFKANGNEVIVDFPSEYQNTTSLFLFGEHRYITGNGAVSDSIGNSIYKLYECKLWDGESLVRNYIPCINPSAVSGLYDLVNNQFYKNKGTGVFTPGPAV